MIKNSTQLIAASEADFKMLKEKGKEGEWALHYHGYLDGYAQGVMDARNGWVSVKERLPMMEYFTMDGDFSKPVLTINADNRYNILIYNIVKGEKFWTFGYDGEGDYIEDSFNQITYWMPIPEITED